MKEPLPNFDKLWDYNDPTATREKFLEILPLAESSGDSVYHQELLTQIARTHGLESDFSSAHAVLDDVERSLADVGPSVRVRYLLERGRAFNSGKRPVDSAPLFTEAWDLARKHALHGYAVDAAHMLGIVEDGDKSLHWNEEAMRYAEHCGDERAARWLGALYNNIGWTYHEMERYEEALTLWRKGLAFHEERKSSTRPLYIARWTIGRGLRSLGRAEEALEEQRKLRLAYEESPIEDMGFVAEEIGECLHALGRAEEARPFFAEAYGKLSQIGWVAEEKERIERLRQLSQPQ
ncbi:MAG: tetratricopeptide repeat protein [Planctomycetota bacterium]